MRNCTISLGWGSLTTKPNPCMCAASPTMRNRTIQPHYTTQCRHAENIPKTFRNYSENIPRFGSLNHVELLSIPPTMLPVIMNGVQSSLEAKHINIFHFVVLDDLDGAFDGVIWWVSRRMTGFGSEEKNRSGVRHIDATVGISPTIQWTGSGGNILNRRERRLQTYG